MFAGMTTEAPQARARGEGGVQPTHEFRFAGGSVERTLGMRVAPLGASESQGRVGQSMRSMKVSS